MDLEKCFYDFQTDNIYVFVLLYDASGSMKEDKNIMIAANKDFYDDFMKFEDKASIVFSQAYFNEFLEMGDFLPIESFSTNYSPGGKTRIYSAISKAIENTLAYSNELTKRKNIKPFITFLCYSDGEDSYNLNIEIENAKEAIKELKESSKKVNTVFVPFREAINSGIAEKLGFDCKKDITSKEELRQFMGKELSKSCKTQSRSSKSLGSKFFSSIADKDESKIETDVFDDDSFFNV